MPLRIINYYLIKANTSMELRKRAKLTSLSLSWKRTLAIFKESPIGVSRNFMRPSERFTFHFLKALFNELQHTFKLPQGNQILIT